MRIDLSVYCPECDEELTNTVFDMTNEEYPKVNVIQFEQTNWYCPECKKTWCIGDIDLIDSEEV